MDQATQVRESRPRPLWRRVIDFPLVAMLLATALYLLAAALAGKLGSSLPLAPGTGRMLLKNALVLGSVLLMYKLVIVRLGKDRRDDLTAERAVPDLAAGLLIGFLIMALAVAAAAVADVYNIVGQGDSTELVRELAATAIMPAFMEELLFRGIFFRWLEQFAGSWLALLLTSAFFGAAHLMNPNATAVAAFGIAVEAGILLGSAYMLTRSLWLAMGIHAAWNFTQGEVFDVPVSGLDEHGLVQAKLSGPPLLSGGGFGLEASIFAMLIATAAGLVLLWLAIRRGRIVGPMWSRRRRASAAS